MRVLLKMNQQDDDIDDFDDGDIAQPQAVSKPPEHTPSHKLNDLAVDEADCYWCSRVGKKNQMRIESKYGIKVYICKEC